MLFLVFLIIASIVFYLYFKMRQFRTTYMLPIRKKLFASMAGAALGLFLITFGLNQILLFNKLVIYIVSAVFIILGSYVLIYNFRAAKHYRQFIEEEAEINEY
ncbi:YtpI family protein [Sporosarcina pasteurii]|uniref:YtpI-like protein n=1 Tax=Sporosarcina pasteurii TaxID=1474 RepID=A0A380C579_SPOPA|nr:YtpI family protein [Sporosarcina pasteurii]MDS9471744.1 YtpI family protein [Sporosarcina pasteurii]QBQ04658.1 hypothetical protein E2C16_02725 [Sporosarcina pasteurii]SUJ13025.1 Uncharacterised protein [Sporosarcina pasteurii]